MFHKHKHYPSLKLFFLTIIIYGLLTVWGANPAKLSYFLGSRLSYGQGVGISASVKPNPYNTLALQLKHKEQRLNQREQELKQKEQEINNQVFGQKIIIFSLVMAVILLFILVLTNFYLDYRRNRHYR